MMANHVKLAEAAVVRAGAMWRLRLLESVERPNQRTARAVKRAAEALDVAIGDMIEARLELNYGRRWKP